jgi:hypothetical protein
MRCKFIWWADPHFGRKGLEPLVDEADTTKVNTIRILSGPDGANDRAGRDFRRFLDEMAALGIGAEWRVVPNQDRDWHDRFIVTEGRAWNVPPINTVYHGRYSEDRTGCDAAVRPLVGQRHADQLAGFMGPRSPLARSGKSSSRRVNVPTSDPTSIGSRSCPQMRSRSELGTRRPKR